MRTLRASTPVARKAQQCQWCYCTIEPGTTYHRSTNIGDDGLYDWVACTDCQALCPVVWDWAYRPDEGIAEYSFAEWARDHTADPEHDAAARAYIARRHPLAAPGATRGEGERDE